MQLGIQIGSGRVAGGADIETGGLPEGIAGHVIAAVQRAGNFDQAGGVRFKDRPGIRMVADGGRVAGQRQDVVYTQGGGPQKLRLQADEIPVPAGQVKDRFQMESV